MSEKNLVSQRDTEDIPSIKQLISEIKGWLSDQEGEYLYLLAKQVPQGQAIVEIGSWHGKSTIWLARGSLAGNRNPVYAIDPHYGSESHLNEGVANTANIFRQNACRAMVDHIVIPVEMKSEEAIKGWSREIGLLWIDGSHKYKDVKMDFEMWAPYLSPLGFVAFHDRDHPGPARVIMEHIIKSVEFFEIAICSQILSARKAQNTRF